MWEKKGREEKRKGREREIKGRKGEGARVIGQKQDQYMRLITKRNEKRKREP